ncbi:MAG TPA: hypothetical protein VLM76_00630 [Patescibacteria group bacterium]|nr:hypothetical protein [Patescibacteria group bacterium]
MKRTLLVAMLAVVVVGCSLGLTTPPPATLKPTYTMPPPTPTLSPLATVGPTGHGRPYTATEMAVALREDVPYNFPPQLQADWVARALADLVWTYDARPYRELGIHGSCDEPPIRCNLTVQGLPAFAPSWEESDSYWFEVRPTSGTFTPAGPPSLQGFPPELVPELDALARSLDTEGRLEAMALRAVAWALPPPDRGFRLVYGPEKYSLDPGYDVLIGFANRRIVSITLVPASPG